jgi:CheY-like chemotaxis protein
MESLLASRREIIGYKGPKRKVLIVDEELTNRMLLAKLLSPLGFEVREAGNSQEGLRQALAFQPDLIIIDLMLPLKRGLELTRSLRQFPALHHRPIIMASASVFEETQRASLEAGSNAFIPKPIQKEALLAEIRRCLKLDWLYEELKPELPAESASLEIIPPPADQVKRLFNLARLGDVAAIQELARELKTLDPQLEPFAGVLLQLAGRFEINKLSQFLEPYLD